MSKKIRHEIQRYRPPPARQPLQNRMSMLSSSSSTTGASENAIIKPYVYEALPSSTTTRVLRLYPGRPDEPLKGTLDFIDLEAEDHTEYWALSYVWGDPAPYGTISLGQSLPIGRNLDEALRRFREDKTQIVLWVDAVCIDQTNVKERGHQVGIMGKIYRRARHVVAWMGPDPTGEAWQYLQAVREKPREPEAIGSGDYGLEEIVKHDWFSRLWVVQEVVLARHAILVWGKCQVPMTDVQSSAYLLNRRTSGSRGLWIGHLKANRGWDVMDVLTWTRALKCTDDRDRVYAILGLPYVREGEVARGIIPDYTKTKSEVYYDFACLCVAGGLLPGLLAAASHGYDWHPQSSDLPSWCPDWALSSHPWNIDAGATAETTWKDQFTYVDRTSRRLCVTGRRQLAVITALDDLDARQQSAARKLTWQDWLRHFVAFYAQHEAKLRENRSQGPEIDRSIRFVEMLFACVRSHEPYNHVAVLRPLVMMYESYQDMYEKDGFTVKQLQAMLEALDRSLEEHAGREGGCFLANNTWNIPHSERLEFYHRAVPPIWQAHRLFTTSEGHIGLGSKAVQLGDTVAIIQGCQDAIILRPHQTDYSFMGLTYVSDVRQEDIMRVWDEDGDEILQEFELR